MNLFRLFLNENGSLGLEVSPWLLLLTVLLIVLVAWRSWRTRTFQHFDLVRINVDLGNIGSLEFKPNSEDIQIAHRIWTELVTRKAALPIDPKNDVIVEVYDSWYALFGRVRQLIGDVPAHLLRKEKSTQQLVSIATRTLNEGLRPHLTRWQAQFRNWYAQHADDLKTKTPQEVQQAFPEYATLLTDMQELNRQLIQYAGELQRIVHGVSEKEK
ncbi:MAG: hypothetical protein HY234_10130 [Acidobacteria bacterium]|nr:hypothetical protein [Acidobacteriota bacterium]